MGDVGEALSLDVHSTGRGKRSLPDDSYESEQYMSALGADSNWASLYMSALGADSNWVSLYMSALGADSHGSELYMSAPVHRHVQIPLGHVRIAP